MQRKKTMQKMWDIPEQPRDEHSFMAKEKGDILCETKSDSGIEMGGHRPGPARVTRLADPPDTGKVKLFRQNVKVHSSEVGKT